MQEQPQDPLVNMLFGSFSNFIADMIEKYGSHGDKITFENNLHKAEAVRSSLTDTNIMPYMKDFVDRGLLDTINILMDKEQPTKEHLVQEFCEIQHLVVSRGLHNANKQVDINSMIKTINKFANNMTEEELSQGKELVLKFLRMLLKKVVPAEKQ